MPVFIKLLTFVMFLVCGLYAYAQTSANVKTKSRTFYAAFGTNRSFYSNSDISFRSSSYPVYNFTLYNVRGKDDGGLTFKHGAPQYSYEAGYYNNKRNWGIELNFDHIKYYVRQFQRVPMGGTINNQLYNTDTLINPDFVQFEHSDGGNYLLLKGMYWKLLLMHQNKILHLVLKGGAGPVIPKTNSTIMGKHRDDKYNIAGYVIALEGGLRYNFLSFMFAEVNAKGAYANYSHFLLADGWGSQRWMALHINVLLGLQSVK